MTQNQTADDALAALDNEIADAIEEASDLDEQAASAWSYVQRLETKRMELMYKLRAELS